ncbi:LPS translocon maturation chaperone LptM [Marinomonas posidonica]
MSKWLAIFILTGFMVACGNKGSLYLPETNLPSQQTSSQN